MAPSIADPTPMRQTLMDLADEDRIEHSPIHLITDEDRSKILGDPKLSKAYDDMKSHRKIHCIVIEMTRPESLTGPSNFSKAAIEDRIECGYEDTYKKLVDEGIITDVREYAIPASA